MASNSARLSRPLVFVTLLLGAFVVAVPRPMTEAQAREVRPDSWFYLYGAEALLHGHYLVDFGDVQLLDKPVLPVGPTVPIYPPGLSLLLAPAIGLGGSLQASLVVPLLAAIALGVGAALIEGRLADERAAPLAVAFAIFTPAVLVESRIVMSDLASAALGLLVVVMLALLRGRGTVAAAGLVAGALAWLRYANVAIIVAGLFAVTALGGSWRRNVLWYLAGAALPILLLAMWQDQTFGSPLATTYQAGGASDHSAGIGAYFSPRFVLGQPLGQDGWELGGLAMKLGLPNGLVYPLQLLGGDPYVLMPGVGVVGLIGLARYARQLGPAGVIGRFGLASIAATLAVYVPYLYQSGRFLILPATMLAVGAASLAAQPLFCVGRHLWSRVTLRAVRRARLLTLWKVALVALGIECGLLVSLGMTWLLRHTVG